MKLARNLIQGTVGGLLGASLLGLFEAIYLLATSGMPDLLSPGYAWVLYGLIGLPFGVAAGLGFTVVEKLKEFKDETATALAFALGMVASFSPMALFAGRYIANKVVYLEQGVPLTGLLAIVGVILVVDAVVLFAGSALLKGPLSFLLKGPGFIGTWAGMAVVLLAASFAPVGDDPKANFASGKTTPDAMKDKPDVLFIMVDTLRADYLGTYGKEGDVSPALDAFADDSVVFEKNFAQASWTRSSGAALFSSRLPTAHQTDTKASRMPDGLTLWSEPLHEAGVTTGALINNINMTSTFNFNQGFDTFVYESPAYAFGATESVFGLTFYKVVHKLNERFLAKHKKVEHFYQPAEVVFDDAKNFIEANKDGRYALFVHLMEPHDPYFEHPYITGEGDAEFNGVGFARAEVENPSMDQADYLKKVYLDEIKHMDKRIADFMAWLKESGRYDNTMIVLTADHGEEFGEHGGFWHGTTLYEEQIHIPLIVKLPNQELASTRVPWQVRSIDVTPTIAHEMGLDAAEDWMGTELLTEVRAWVSEQEAAAKALEDAAEGEEGNEGEEGAEVPATEGEAAEGEAADGEAADGEAAEAEPEVPTDPCAERFHPRDRVVVSEEDFEGNVIKSIRKEGYKYIQANAGNPRGLPEEVLYDVYEDAGETTDVLGKKTCGLFGGDRETNLKEEVASVVKDAMARRAGGGGKACISDTERQQLIALGYMSADEKVEICE